MSRFLLIVIAAITLSTQAQAADMSFEDLMNSEGGSLVPRVTEGVIRSIDLVSRTGVISGYKYWFGPADLFDLQVYLYQSNAGSLELLQEGMKVEVTYTEKEIGRIAFVIRQLADDTETEF